MKTHGIELLRMTTGVESCTVEVDSATLERIKTKTMSRSELNELFEDRYVTNDVVENELPHTVYVINRGGYPSVVDYEDEPCV